MSRLAKKVHIGEAATDEDWTEFLVQAHSKVPGMTEKCFEKFSTDVSESNSYQFLCDKVQKSLTAKSRVLDLACGDGPLAVYLSKIFNAQQNYAGIDLVESEIAIAKKRNLGPNFDFRVANACQLPFDDGSFDLVVSHLALMLILPIEEALKHVKRVLRSDGKLIAVLGRDSSQRGMADAMGAKAMDFMKARISELGSFKTGDPRTKNVESLKKLLEETGFSNIQTQELHLKVRGTPDEVWATLEHFYVFRILKEEDKNHLAQLVKAELETQYEQDSVAKLDIPLTFVSAETR